MKPTLLAQKFTNPVIGSAGEGEGASIIARLIAIFLQIIFIGGAVALLFMLLWGGVQWITAGGDKDKTASAQKKITGAIIGFAAVACAMTIVTLVGYIFSIDFLQDLIIDWPSLSSTGPTAGEWAGQHNEQP